MFFQKLSGSIPESKQREFEQTYKYAITQIPGACTAFSVTKDALEENVYHFTSYWESNESLHAFTQSTVFLMMVGAFNTLGNLYENIKGEMVSN